MMKASQFDPQVCLQALREALIALDGKAPEVVGQDPRIMWYLRAVSDGGVLRAGCHLVDVGAGTSLFGAIARKLGLTVTLVDDFGGGGGLKESASYRNVPLLRNFEDKLGIRVVQQDVLAEPLPLANASVDIVTTFNSLEHWHHSPKRLFAEITRVLRPHGLFLIVTPNAANLRKRIFAVFGENIYDRLDWWYDEPVFRGHVREPIVRDLKQMLAWNDFEICLTRGANFLGRDSKALAFLPTSLVQSGVTAVDHMLRLFPTLCSDILVMGRRRT